MLNIIEGKISRALKIVIYGSEGIGKSTLASRFPDPLIIDTEGGTAHMDVRRIQKPATWTELLFDVQEVAKTDGICKTLVIDTADWAEQLCIDHVCTQYKQKSIEAFGYGKGYTYLGEEFSRMISNLDAVIASGKHVVVTAHAKMRKFEQPDEMGAYDRWEMKLSRQVAPLLKEWADMLLFMNYKTYVIETENNTHKAKGGKRVIYTTHNPCWDAKNRHDLPEEMEASFDSIAHLFENEPKRVAPIDTVHELMERDGITEAEICEVACQRKKADEGLTQLSELDASLITDWVIKYWPQIVEAVKQNRVY